MTSSSFSKYRESQMGVLIVSSLAVFTDMVIYGVIMPIIKEIIEKYEGITAENRYIAQAALPAVYAAGLIIFTPVFASLSDRYKTRKIPMLLGQLLLATSTLMFAFVRSFYLCLFARFLQGIAGAATWVVGLAMLVDVFNGPDLGFYMGIVFGCHNLGFFLGPLIGGFLHDFFGIQAPFFACTALAMIDFVGRLWIKEPKIPHNEKEKSDLPTSKKELGLSMLDLARKPEVFLLCVVIAFKAASFASLESMLEMHLHDHFNYTPSDTSLVFLAFIVPNIFAVIVVGWLSGRITRYVIITIGLILHPMAAPLITSTSSIKQIIFGGVLFGVSISTAGSPVSPELAEIVKSYGGASYARIYGILNISYSFGILAGPPIVGLITRNTSFFIAMSSLTSLTLFYSPVFYFKMKKLYRKRLNRLILIKSEKEEC